MFLLGVCFVLGGRRVRKAANFLTGQQAVMSRTELPPV